MNQSALHGLTVLLDNFIAGKKAGKATVLQAANIVITNSE
jgi:hypothetical protein